MDSHAPRDEVEIRLKLNIKFSGRSIPVEIAANSTIKDLKSLLQTLTNVLPRGQKLIFRGQVLSDELTLASSDISNGSKIMLMASQGLHQGDGPIKKEVVLPGVRASTEITRGKKEKIECSVVKNQLERWKVTRIIALSDCGLTVNNFDLSMKLKESQEAGYGGLLEDIHVHEVGTGMLDLSVVLLRLLMLLSWDMKSIPEEVWSCGPARVLDLSQNSLFEVPAKICCLSSLQKLLLNGNHLSDESIAWEGVRSLNSLMVLSLNQNNLTTIPSSLGALTCLKQLLIASNKLTSLPNEIGLLTELEVLKAQTNRLETSSKNPISITPQCDYAFLTCTDRLQAIPTSLGGCVSLVEVDLSFNLLTELPETFGNLKNLKALYLSNNGLKSLPNTLFKMCLQLSILDLHGTEITTDVVRQFEGWDSFEERRRVKHQKQLDFRVAGSAEFDEGADKNW